VQSLRAWQATLLASRGGSLGGTLQRNIALYQKAIGMREEVKM
jgi:hypothetical protein